MGDANGEALDADRLADLGPSEWAAVDPEELRDVDMSEVPDEALPTDRRCPRCHWPVFQVTTMGPKSHVLGPCGCRVSMLER